jgi:integrase/recombinase XerD
MTQQSQGTRLPWRAEETPRRQVDTAIWRAPRGWRRCLRAFATWLESERELALSTITHRIVSMRTFLTTHLGAVGGVRKLRRLGVTDIEDFFIGYAKTSGPMATRQMQAGLRLFLTFAGRRGWARDDLAGAVPSLRTYRLSGVPRGFDDEQVRQLIRASAECSRRNQALILLLAVYGVRRGQVAALRFQDIDWRARTIRFAGHKECKTVKHELMPAVAEALVAYVQDERPPSDHAAVFLRAKRPYLPLNPGVISFVVSELCARLRIEGPPHGPHALRHAFATRLLHAGQPLEVIADLLGHRSLASVAVYAKVDHPRLLEVAREWPEVLS